MALPDYDDSRHTSSFAPQSHLSARTRRQTDIGHLPLHTPSQEHAVGPVSGQLATLPKPSQFSNTLQPIYHQQELRHNTTHHFLTNTHVYTSSASHHHHRSGSSSANTSMSPPVTARLAVHPSIVPSNQTAHISLPMLRTGAAPQSQQQAPRHFLTNNHLVRHLPINRHLMVSSATKTPPSLHHRSDIVSPHPILTMCKLSLIHQPNYFPTNRYRVTSSSAGASLLPHPLGFLLNSHTGVNPRQ